MRRRFTSLGYFLLLILIILLFKKKYIYITRARGNRVHFTTYYLVYFFQFCFQDIKLDY